MLVTYTAGPGSPFFGVVPLEDGALLRPGVLVRHALQKGTRGTLVAVWDGEDGGRHYSVLWSHPPDGKVNFPGITKAKQGLIAHELIKVQPMSLPSGLLFYMDYTYGSGSAGEPGGGDDVPV